jgi:hypothetical protein
MSLPEISNKSRFCIIAPHNYQVAQPDPGGVIAVPYAGGGVFGQKESAPSTLSTLPLMKEASSEARKQ